MIVKPTHMIAALFALSVAAGGASCVLADTIPVNKAGLWVNRNTSNGRMTEVKMCIDNATQAQMTQMGMAMTKDMCSSNQIKRMGDTVTIDSVCKVMKSTVTSHAVYHYHGDVAYEGKIDSGYAPPMMGKTSSVMTIDAKWSGACPAGMVPGDMIMPGGIKMHMGKDGVPTMKGR